MGLGFLDIKEIKIYFKKILNLIFKNDWYNIFNEKYFKFDILKNLNYGKLIRSDRKQFWYDFYTVHQRASWLFCVGYQLCFVSSRFWYSVGRQVPGSGACVGRGTLRLPGQERSTHPQGSSQILQTDHFRSGFLSQSQYLVKIRRLLGRVVGLLFVTSFIYSTQIKLIYELNNFMAMCK